jgi:hypothetical protein
LVWVPAAVKHNRPQSANVVKSWKSAYDELPECLLKAEAIEELRDSMKAMGDAFQDAFQDAFPKESEKHELSKKQEARSKKDPPKPPRGASEKTKQTKKAAKPKAAKPTDPNHQPTVEAYFVAFESARGEKPTFTGREAKAVSQLLEKAGPEKALRCIRNAYTDPFWSKTATILSIASDPDKVSTSRTNGPQSHVDTAETKRRREASERDRRDAEEQAKRRREKLRAEVAANPPPGLADLLARTGQV